MAENNGINWNQVRSQTDNAAGLVIHSLGNLSNGLQSLGANTNTGLDREIDRRDRIDQKNRTSNTQFLLNQMNNATTLEDKLRLKSQGFGDLHAMRGLVNNGEIDEKGLNSAIAQWDQGIMSRYNTNDNLKITTPEGQEAFRQLQFNAATQNTDGVTNAINNPNISNQVAATAANTGSNLTSVGKAEDQYNRDQAQRYGLIQNSYYNQLNQQKDNNNLKMFEAALNNNQTAQQVFGNFQQNATLQFGGVNELNQALNSSNEAVRQKAVDFIKTSKDGFTKYGLDSKAVDQYVGGEYGKLAIDIGSNKINTGSPTNTTNLNIPYNSAPVPQQPTPTATNTNTPPSSNVNLLKGTDTNQLVNSVIKQNNQPLTPRRLDAIAQADAINEFIGDKAEPTTFASKEQEAVYNSAKAAATKALVAQHGNRVDEVKNKVSELNKQANENTKLLTDSQYKINADSGKSYAFSDLTTKNPDSKLDEATLANLVRLTSQNDKDGAAKLLGNSVFADESELSDWLPNWVSKETKLKMANDTLDAYTKSGNNPEVLKMAENVYGMLKKENEGKSLVNTGSDSNQANTFKKVLSQLGDVNENTYKEYVDNSGRLRKAFNLPEEVVSSAVFGKATPDSIIADANNKATVEAKELNNRAKEAKENTKEISTRFPNIATALEIQPKYKQNKNGNSDVYFGHKTFNTEPISEREITNVVGIKRDDYNKLKELAKSGNMAAQEQLDKVDSRIESGLFKLK